MDENHTGRLQIPAADVHRLQAARLPDAFGVALHNRADTPRAGTAATSWIPGEPGARTCGCPDGPAPRGLAGDDVVAGRRDVVTFADFSLDTTAVTDEGGQGDLAALSIGRIVSGCYPPCPPWGAGWIGDGSDDDVSGDEDVLGDGPGEPVFFDPPADEDDGDTPVPGEEPGKNGCVGEFIDVRSGGRRRCDDIVRLRLKRTRSIPIVWAIVGTAWTRGDVLARMGEAGRWFRKYCIELDIRELDIDQKLEAITPDDKKKQATNSLSQARAALERTRRQKGSPYLEAVVALYREIWRYFFKRQRSMFLLVLFVDPYEEMQGDSAGKRPDAKVSTNLTYSPVITITRTQNIPHIVTHELVHGLGKVWSYEQGGTTYNGLPRTEPYGSDSERGITWEHGGGQQSCEEDMGNAVRIRETNRLDLAAYRMFVKRKTIVRA